MHLYSPTSLKNDLHRVVGHDCRVRDVFDLRGVGGMTSSVAIGNTPPRLRDQGNTYSQQMRAEIGQDASAAGGLWVIGPGFVRSRRSPFSIKPKML